MSPALPGSHPANRGSPRDRQFEALRADMAAGSMQSSHTRPPCSRGFPLLLADTRNPGTTLVIPVPKQSESRRALPVLQQRCVVENLQGQLGQVREQMSAYRQLLERSLPGFAVAVSIAGVLAWIQALRGGDRLAMWEPTRSRPSAASASSGRPTSRRVGRS